MDDKIINMAIALCKAIQQDERFLALKIAEQQNDDDKELNAAIGKFNLVRMNINGEMGKEERDQEKLDKLNAEMRELYAGIMQNPNMMKFTAAKNDVDDLAQKINTLIMQSVNGVDPETVDLEAACGGDCSGCAGCGH